MRVRRSCREFSDHLLRVARNRSTLLETPFSGAQDLEVWIASPLCLTMRCSPKESLLIVWSPHSVQFSLQCDATHLLWIYQCLSPISCFFAVLTAITATVSIPVQSQPETQVPRHIIVHHDRFPRPPVVSVSFDFRRWCKLSHSFSCYCFGYAFPCSSS